MTMLKALPDIAVAVTGPLAGVELGETPFFPGGNAILRLSAAPAGAIVLNVQGSPTGVTSPDSYTTIKSLNAAAMKGLAVEITDLPKYLRLNVATGGTAATIAASLEGVQ